MNFKECRPMDFDQFEIVSELKVRRHHKRRAQLWRALEVTVWCLIIPTGCLCLGIILKALVARYL